MPLTRTYLDHNATAPVRPEASAAFVEALSAGNPSSIHAEGRRGRALVETARARVAALVGAAPGLVVFTSGGTEGNATLLRPGALLDGAGRPVERLLVGATEHASVLDGHGFPADAVEVLPVDGSGRVDPGDVARRLAGSRVPALVSVQVANSETGVIQPVAGLSAVVRAAGAAIHVDGVQAAGRTPLGELASTVDAVTLSAHKLGGVMGAGAIVVAAGRSGPARPLVRGGGQENGVRSGTENVPAIAAFGAAAEGARRALVAGEEERLRALRNEAERVVGAIAPGAVLFGASAPRLPNTLAFALPEIAAGTLLAALDLAGFALSSGSACRSGTVGRSHVLAAMGVDRSLAAGLLRLSLGWSSTSADIVRFRAAFEIVLHRLYERRRSRAA